MSVLNRRGFLGAVGGLLAGGAVLDPERLLWRPGAKLISIPRPPVWETLTVRVEDFYVSLKLFKSLWPSSAAYGEPMVWLGPRPDGSMMRVIARNGSLVELQRLCDVARLPRAPELLLR